MIEGITSLPLEEVALDQLKPHPRNYRSHPEDEIMHLVESIRANGIYRNIVIACEGTILAGRGVTIAARRAGYTSVPVYRAAFGPDDPCALKLLVADNEISHLAENDDRALTELLRELKENEIDLLGTGYDEMMLANLVYVTRPASEVQDLDAAAQWVGMPEYEEGKERIQLILNFDSEEDRTACRHLLHLDIGLTSISKTAITAWWPARPRDHVQAARFTDRKEGT